MTRIRKIHFFILMMACIQCTGLFADGSPLCVDKDYMGEKRDGKNTFPGPFEKPVNGEIKVWPK